MKKEESLLHLIELSTSELLSTSGGGEADDLAYNLTFAGLAANPFYWVLRYNGWALNKLLR
ncbi:MAG: hypothetical protein WD577_01765 [Bacteroidales bacterium]